MDAECSWGLSVRAAYENSRWGATSIWRASGPAGGLSGAR